ncbi:cytochrome b5-like heme/steroid binding domain-containing protein [Aspergillus ambiguus]|uniref:cytochrome b5-like heme/steroid binding domain-containing protein n=1 Tax=Aspergillus ambiguus TaxID=176160 RepID=UPI003CCD9759
MLKAVTQEQLASHNTPQSLWIAVHGRVYDLTTFGADHPGGFDVLESCAGTDGTEAYEYAGHSEDNMMKMQQFCVGELGGSLAQPPISNSPHAEEARRKKSMASASQQLTVAPWMKRAVPLSAAGLSIGLSFFCRWPTLQLPKFEFATCDQNTGHAFWAGVAVASSISFVGFRYLYKLFLSSLDYRNDVFSFPPTIPKKTRR